MKRGFLIVGIIGAWILLAGSANAQTALDITKREVTDPLLKIRTSTTMFAENDQFFKIPGKPVADRTSKPPVFNHLWGKEKVILLNPMTKEHGAEIDFSAITGSNTGKLSMEIHRHPLGDAELEVYQGNIRIKKWSLKISPSWHHIEVNFKNEPVRLVLNANGWYYEFAFVTYTIEPAKKGL